jgi:two-component system chemotaxis sensor kinase CheA
MGSVRIATKKLDRLIAGSDDLLTTRLFITQRVQELEEMASRFSVWHWNSEMIYTDLYRIRETAFGTQKSILPPDLVLPLQRVVEFLEYDREFCNALQHDLSTHVRATELDQAALAASTQEISELIHDAVLQPVSSILVSFPGFVREFSRSSGKKAEVRTIGGEIEVDRRILDRLKDPILHLIRNSIDHGIESPRIRAAASKDESGTILIRTTTLAGSKVRIEVSDDGRGIDPAAIRRSAIENGVITPKEGVKITDDEAIWLIFRSGMSTSPVVTDLSGRGLGLAIVEDTVTRLGGELTVSTGTGKGTTITITIPVRLATFRGVVVRSGMQRFVFPMQQVQQVIRTREDGILMKGNSAVLPYQNGTIGVIRLAGILGMTGPGKSGSNPDLVPMVILAYGAGQIACMVDEVIRVQEIVVRPLGSQLRRVKWITGAAILGDGTVALVLDPLEMIQDAIKTRQPVPAPGERNERGAQTILLVEDSVTSRMLLQAILGQAGYTVMTASDGTEAFAMLKEHEFDIVVSDVDMPRMSGFTLTEKIRSDTRLSRIPVILVTSLDSQEDQEHGMAVGASAYIVKSSFERDDLLRVLEDIGRRPQ